MRLPCLLVPFLEHHRVNEVGESARNLLNPQHLTRQSLLVLPLAAWGPLENVVEGLTRGILGKIPAGIARLSRIMDHLYSKFLAHRQSTGVWLQSVRNTCPFLRKWALSASGPPWLWAHSVCLINICWMNKWTGRKHPARGLVLENRVHVSGAQVGWKDYKLSPLCSSRLETLS